MLSVDERVFQAKEVVVIVLVELCVELEGEALEGSKKNGRRGKNANRVQHTRSRTDTSIILWLK